MYSWEWEEKNAKEEYSIKSFQTILVLKSSEKKPIPYKGDVKFRPIFEFLNV